MFNTNWDKRFLRLADEVASWSKDPSTQVGCVLVDDKKRVIGMGYNGFARGVKDSLSLLNNRPIKYQMIIHAEANALLNAVANVEGAHAYVSQRPCAPCMALLLQSGITSLISRTPSVGLAQRLSESFTIADQMAQGNMDFLLLDEEAYTWVSKRTKI